MTNQKNKDKEQVAMNTGVNWANLRGQIKKEFPNVNDSDLQFMARGENELIGRLQMKSGRTRSQIRTWVRSTAKII